MSYAPRITNPTQAARGRWRGAVRGLAACALAALVAPVQAAGATTDKAMALARENVCLGCHQVDARRVGPPFRAIGERYAGKGEDAANAAYLAQAIQQGSRGKWGALTMPAQPQVDDDEARQLAEWILTLGKTTP